MNKFTKFVILPLLMVGLAGCDLLSPTENVEASVANARVAQAMNQMTSTEMNSFELSVTASLGVDYGYFDETSTRVETNTIDASGSIEIKASNPLEENGRVSVVANANVNVVEGTSTVMDEEISGSLYYADGWAYIHVTGFTFPDMSGSTTDEIKGKTNVGSFANLIENATGMPTSELTPTSEGLFPTEDMAEMLSTIDGVAATEKDGELTVVYTVTVDDIVDVYIKMAEMSGEFDPSQFSSSEFAALRGELFDQISSVITINSAKITVGVSEDGYLSKFYIDVDVVITEMEYDWETEDTVIGKTVVAIDADFKIDLSNVNKTVTVTLPSDLDTYQNMDAYATPETV